MKRLLLAVSCSNEYYNADCDYAVVEITDDFLATIRKRVVFLQDLRKHDSDLASMSYHDYSASYHNSVKLESWLGGDGDLLDAAYDGLVVELPDYVNLDSIDAERTECERMEVTNDAIYFTAYPKHCGWQASLETTAICIEELFPELCENKSPQT